MDSNMYSFHVVERGSSHVLIDKPCQDFAMSLSSPSYAIGIVADGHGSDKYFRSERGSKFAVEVTMEILKEFLSSTNNMTCLPNGDWQKQIAASIISHWNDRIENDKTNEPFTDEELQALTDSDRQHIEEGNWQSAYGTTLIAIVRTKKCFLGLHIGDGKCVTIDSNGNPSQPIPWDDRCFLNQTTSLCDNDAINLFRFVYLTDNLPVAAFVASDGVDDTYSTDERLYDLYVTIWKMFLSDSKAALKNVQSFLPNMSEQGSHDDISIAGILSPPQKSWFQQFIESL